MLKYLSIQNLPYIHCILRCGSPILYCSRISKNVTDKHTDREQGTEIPITEATLIPWIARLSEPIEIVKSDEYLTSTARDGILPKSFTIMLFFLMNYISVLCLLVVFTSNDI